MNPAEAFRRWRASKGYGVHSPLAFRIVKNVVRPPRDVAYYGEERLSVDARDMSGSVLRRARLLLRFVAELQPSYVWAPSGLSPLYRDAVSLAGCVVRVLYGKVWPDPRLQPDMMILDGGNVTKSELANFLRPGRSLAALGVKPGMAAKVAGAMKAGMVIDGVGSVLAVTAPEGALHEYSVSAF